MELNIWQLQELFSKKAFSFFSKRLNSYVIAYNDVLPLTEAVYQVFHEIGHIYYGHISPDEEDDFTAVSKELDKLAVSISELRLIKEKLIKKSGDARGC